MRGVQCYELFGGIALKNHAFSFFIGDENGLIKIDYYYSPMHNRFFYMLSH